MSVNSGVVVCDDTSTIKEDSSTDRQSHFRRCYDFSTASKVVSSLPSVRMPITDDERPAF